MSRPQLPGAGEIDHPRELFVEDTAGVCLFVGRFFFRGGTYDFFYPGVDVFLRWTSSRLPQDDDVDDVWDYFPVRIGI